MGPKHSERKNMLKNCKTKTLMNFNVDYKHFRLKILKPIYKNLEAMQFTSDFASNPF